MNNFFTRHLSVFYLIRLVARNYYKNYSSIFTDFVLPMIVMTILFNVLEKEAVSLMLPGILLSPIASSCFISFAICYADWKQSIIVKKIRVSQISTTQLFLSFLIFYFFISLFSFSFGLSYTLLLSEIGLQSLENFETSLSKVNWLWGITAIIQLILIGCVCGYLIGVLSKKTSHVIAMGLTLFLIQSFLLGYYLPVNLIIGKQNTRITSYFMPFYAPTRMFQYNWFKSSETKVFWYSLNEFKEWVPHYTNYVSENWKVLNIDGNYLDESSFIKFNFHPSYWSLILLSFGWFATIGTTSTMISKYGKFD